MKFGRISLDMRDPAGLSEKELDELLRFRLSHVRLRQEVDPEEDRQKFRQTVRLCRRVIQIRRGPRLLGMSVVLLQTCVVEDLQFLWVRPEYTFTDRTIRGHLVIPIATMLLSRDIYLAGRDVKGPIVLSTATYLPGWLAMADAFPGMYLLGEEQIPPWLRRLGPHLGRLIAGHNYCGVQNRVRMPTQPLDTLRHPRRRSTQELVSRYLTNNPEWQGGYGAVILGQLDRGTLVSLAKTSVRRMLPHKNTEP